MSPPSGRGNRVLKMVYPMAPLIMEDLNSDDFLIGGLNVYSWDRELPCNKAVLPDTGLLHPSPALECIFIMLIFAVIIQHLLYWQSHTELFRTAKGWFGFQSKFDLDSLFPSFFLLQINLVLISPSSQPCWLEKLEGKDRGTIWGATPESQGIYS